MSSDIISRVAVIEILKSAAPFGGGWGSEDQQNWEESVNEAIEKVEKLPSVAPTLLIQRNQLRYFLATSLDRELTADELVEVGKLLQETIQ